MISVYRNTLTRLDLSSVLHYMVENAIEGSGAGEHLAKECARRMSYDYAVAFRSPADALRAASAIASDDPEAKRLCALPVFAPSYLYFALQQDAAVDTLVYDVDDNCIDPHHDEIKKFVQERSQHDVSLLVRYLHFGLYSDEIFKHFETHKQSKQTLTVDICTYPHEPLVSHETHSEVLPEDSKKKTTTTQDIVRTGADICIVLCESNTLFTGGGGAIVCVRGKNLSRRLKKHKETCVLLSDINASLALAQLKQLDTFIDKTKKISKILLESLRDTRHSGLAGVSHENIVLQTLPLLIPSRTKEIVSFAAKQGIETSVAFDNSIYVHMNKEKQNRNLEIENRYNNAGKMFSRVLCFPLYPSLDGDEVRQLAKVIAALP